MALLLVCGTVYAAEWVSLGKSDDGTTETFVDVSSVRVVGDIRRAWAKAVFAPHVKKDFGSEKWWQHSVSLFAFNCAEETSRLEATTVYYTDGDNASVKGPPSPWSPVTPETLEHTVMEFVCAWKPK